MLLILVKQKTILTYIYFYVYIYIIKLKKCILVFFKKEAHALHSSPKKHFIRLTREQRYRYIAGWLKLIIIPLEKGVILRLNSHRQWMLCAHHLRMLCARFN